MLRYKAKFDEQASNAKFTFAIDESSKKQRVIILVSLLVFNLICMTVVEDF